MIASTIVGALLIGGVLWLARGWIIHQCEVLFSGKPRKTNRWLGGNFGPVPETAGVDLHVEGVLPEALNGAYVRNGPNPQFPPIGGRYHWFDGDGMLHAVRIAKGKASYSCALVDTSRLKQERRGGRPLFTTLGALEGSWGLVAMALARLKVALGLLDYKDGMGTANTSVAFHNKQLLALHEADFPYAVRVHNDARIETLGRETYGGRLFRPFTAHPKVDPVTGELHGFGYRSRDRPYLHYFVIGAGGLVKKDMSINIPDPVMMHDFAMTEQHVVFLDFPLMFSAKNLAAGKSLYSYNASRAARFGVLPKSAEDEGAIRWFELPEAMFAFHVANAWQEGDVLRLFLCAWQGGYELDSRLEHRNRHALLTEVTLDLGSGEAAQRVVAPVHCEFPTVPPSLLGRKCRYIYLAEFEAAGHNGSSSPPITGIAKIDLTVSSPEAAVAGRIPFGEGRIGGEAVFIPNTTSSSSNGSATEDDGYLATYVYDSASDSSDFVVYDAKTCSEKPVASVRLPQRVPYGFHGMHINAAQFEAQFPFDIHFLPSVD